MIAFVPDWRSAWKWFSVHALTVAGVLPATWCSLPAEWRAVVPVHIMAIATFITAALGVIGRITDQKSKPDDNAEHA